MSYQRFSQTVQNRILGEFEKLNIGLRLEWQDVARPSFLGQTPDEKMALALIIKRLFNHEPALFLTFEENKQPNIVNMLDDRFDKNFFEHLALAIREKVNDALIVLQDQKLVANVYDRTEQIEPPAVSIAEETHAISGPKDAQVDSAAV